MIFGAISREGKSDIWFKPEKMTIDSQSYIEILESVLVPFAEQQYKFGTRR
jgi:hypothetical protein